MDRIMSVFDKGSPAALFAAVAAGAAMKYAAGAMFKFEDPKTTYRYVGKVGEIWVYPIKSFKGIKVDSADATPLGMKWHSFTDRLSFSLITKKPGETYWADP